MAEQTIWNESREMGIYHAGQKVEIKSRPGIVDTVIAYDPYMVPPIVLASDPQPRYPEELTLVSHPGQGFDWFNPLSRAMSAHKIASSRQAISSSRR
jgi:hypothetical protein